MNTYYVVHACCGQKQTTTHFIDSCPDFRCVDFMVDYNDSMKQISAIFSDEIQWRHQHPQNELTADLATPKPVRKQFSRDPV